MAARATMLLTILVQPVQAQSKAYSLIAQSVERRTVNPQVGGSNPPRGANNMLEFIKKLIERIKHKRALTRRLKEIQKHDPFIYK